MIRWVWAWLALMAAPVAAQTCQDVQYLSNQYTICEIDPAQHRLSLFLRDARGQVLGGFGAVARELAREGKRLGFAMNAGMYHDDRRPVGLYIQDRAQEGRLIANAGPGNFGLLPNGVFCIGEGQAQVYETLDFQRRGLVRHCKHATQSGPMLVIDGALHPRFLPDSTSRYIRNGVGTSVDGTRVVFAISNNAVTFHEFGSLFRNHLKTPNALYFDGSVSRLYAPELGRNDRGRMLGPIVGLVLDVAG